MTYNLNNLADMLSEMADYLNENEGQGYEKDFNGSLFELLTNTALFHDACGKEIERGVNEVVVTTDY